MTDTEPWWIAPRLVRWLITAYLAGAVATTLDPALIRVFGLISPLGESPIGPASLLTYPLVPAGLAHWAQIALLTWLPAIVLRGRMDQREMGAALLAGSLVGGAMFVALSSQQYLVGGVMAAWGLAGASFGAFLRRRSRFRGWRRAYAFALGVLLLVAAMAGTPNNRALLAGAVAGAVVGLARPPGPEPEPAAS